MIKAYNNENVVIQYKDFYAVVPIEDYPSPIAIFPYLDSILKTGAYKTGEIPPNLEQFVSSNLRQITQSVQVMIDDYYT
jgi:hypothetical protein